MGATPSYPIITSNRFYAVEFILRVSSALRHPPHILLSCYPVSARFGCRAQPREFPEWGCPRSWALSLPDRLFGGAFASFLCLCFVPSPSPAERSNLRASRHPWCIMPQTQRNFQAERNKFSPKANKRRRKSVLLPLGVAPCVLCTTLAEGVPAVAVIAIGSRTRNGRDAPRVLLPVMHLQAMHLQASQCEMRSVARVQTKGPYEVCLLSIIIIIF